MSRTDPATIRWFLRDFSHRRMGAGRTGSCEARQAARPGRAGRAAGGRREEDALGTGAGDEAVHRRALHAGERCTKAARGIGAGGEAPSADTDSG